MPIIVLSDVILSDDVVAAGARGKNMRHNSRVVMNSGDETINVVWSQTLREFELGVVPMSTSAWQEIETLHEITEGGAYGFLMEDPKDSYVASGVVVAGPDGSYQLYKRYVHRTSGRYKDRKITRPQAATFQLLNADGTPFTGSYSLYDATGQITASVDPSTLTWSGRFWVPVHFMEDSIDWDIVRPGTDNRLLVAGPSVVLQEVRE